MWRKRERKTEMRGESGEWQNSIYSNKVYHVNVACFASIRYVCVINTCMIMCIHVCTQSCKYQAHILCHDELHMYIYTVHACMYIHMCLYRYMHLYCVRPTVHITQGHMYNIICKYNIHIRMCTCMYILGLCVYVIPKHVLCAIYDYVNISSTIYIYHDLDCVYRY